MRGLSSQMLKLILKVFKKYYNFIEIKKPNQYKIQKKSNRSNLYNFLIGSNKNFNHLLTK
jgi:hypothetical protein